MGNNTNRTVERVRPSNRGGTAVLEDPRGFESQEGADTEARLVDLEGQVAAIGKSQAVIEFNLDGTIITANDNFLNALGYRLDEVKGKHHSLFVDDAYRQSPAYREFWAKLNRGEYEAGEFKRIGKGGKEVWIQASYNPILDRNGKPFKVVKYATDITAAKKREIETTRAVGMVENAPINIMFADHEFKITYVNPSSVKTLKGIEYLLPVKADQVLGQSIDIFHKKPEHQRKILSDPKNLPHRTSIQVGPETLDLLVSPIYDHQKNYLGAMVTWEVITRVKGLLDVVNAATAGDLTREILVKAPTRWARWAKGWPSSSRRCARRSPTLVRTRPRWPAIPRS